MRELKPEELRREINLESLGFKSSEKILGRDKKITEKILEKRKIIVGQERALKSLWAAVGMKGSHDHIFVAGPEKIGRVGFVKLCLEEIAKDQPTPPDICYIYNFDEPDSPIAVFMPAGTGKIFKKEMENLFISICAESQTLIGSSQFEKMGFDLRENFFQIDDQEWNQLEEEAEEAGFEIDREKLKIIGKKELEDLSLKGRESYERKNNDLLVKLKQRFFFETQIDRMVIKAQGNTYKILFGQILDRFLNPFVKIYQDQNRADYEPKIDHLLRKIKEFLLEKSSIFLEPDFSPDIISLPFRINVFVDHSKTKGAPIIESHICNYHNLFGKIEKTYDGDGYYTDHDSLMAGAIHKANGGYLILKISDLFSQPEVFIIWPMLINTLRAEQIEISDSPKLYDNITVKTLRPESIPLDVKIILVGNYEDYEIFSQIDPQFNRIFSKKIELDDVVKFSLSSETDYIGFIASYAERNSLLPFDNKAAARLLEHGLEIAEHSEYISLKMTEIRNILREADFWARDNKRNIIRDRDVEEAIKLKKERSGLIEEKFRIAIADKKIEIDTAGRKIGQINGLSVFCQSDNWFAVPSRITARTFRGDKRIIDIDTEADLAGRSHRKGVLTLIGYLQGEYGRDRLLAISVSITFEQEYDETDGPSASAAELLVTLSSLADIPIFQGLAVTGTISQFGEVQSIGAVNVKIKGWFKTCEEAGLTGSQGVIISESNVKELMLQREIVEAVKKGLFHIYAIKTIEEGMELLTGRSMEEVKKSIHKRLNNGQGILHFLKKIFFK